MTTFTVVVLSAGLGQPSSTRMLANQLARSAGKASEDRGDRIEAIPVELRELAHDITDHLVTGFPSLPLRAAIEAVSFADALIAVTPVFSASYSGLFKSFFDVLDPVVLTDTPVLIAATGGSARHSLVLDYALRPLFSYLRATIVPTAVFAATADFGSDDAGRLLTERVDRAGNELATMLRLATLEQDGWGGPDTGSGSAVRSPTGQSPDPFDQLVPFKQLLARR